MSYDEFCILIGEKPIIESECFLLQFDGLAQPNPGYSSSGAIIFSEARKPLFEIGRYLGYSTNNIAEYTGLIIGLEYAIEKGVKKLLIEGDSQLIIFQTIGKWKVNNETLRNLNTEVKNLLLKFEYVGIKHIGRNLNKKADRITNEVIKTKHDFTIEYKYE